MKRVQQLNTKVAVMEISSNFNHYGAVKPKVFPKRDIPSSIVYVRTCLNKTVSKKITKNPDGSITTLFWYDTYFRDHVV